MNNITIDRLSSLWTKQLHLEFDDICWQHRIELTPPSFEISKAKQTLGAWDAATRTIRISGFLILNHAWGVTMNVLRHEIAHQICSEVFFSQEVAHGHDFIRACQFLGLPEEFQGASGDLPEGVGEAEKGRPLTKEGRQYIAKVEKLLALAKSANEHEAHLAMEKASELMTKFNITRISLGQDSNLCQEIINLKKKRIESYKRTICSILKNFFHVQVITASQYDPLSDQTHKTIEIFGSSENVAVAEYCYHFLDNKLRSLWAENRHKYHRTTITEKNSYYLGVLRGFNEKLRRQNEKFTANKQDSVFQAKQGSNWRSLVVAEDKQLDEYIAKTYPRLGRARNSGPRIYQSTYDAGIAAGKKINLHKGVNHKDGNRGNLLC